MALNRLSGSTPASVATVSHNLPLRGDTIFTKSYKSRRERFRRDNRNELLEPYYFMKGTFMSKEKLPNLYLLPNPWWKDYFSKELLLIDTKDHDILNRLDDKNVKYKLYGCFERPDPQDKYSIVHLRIRYRYAQGLLDELERFCKNAPLLGYTDYEDYCKMICNKLTGKDKKEND